MLLKKRNIIIDLLIILIVSFSSIILGQEQTAGTPEARALELRNLLDSIEGMAEEPPRIFTTQDGYLRFIMAPPSTCFAVEQANSKTPEEVAGTFLQRWRDLFVNESPTVTFDVIRIKTSHSRSYVRYQQTYAGLKVKSAQMIVQVNAAGGIEAVISDIMQDTTELDTGKVSVNPSIDFSTAQKKAVEFLAAQHPQLKFEASPATLMIFCPSVVGNTGPVQLIWQTEVCNVGEPLVKELVLVEAHTGEIAFHYSLIYSTKWRRIWDYEGRVYNPIEDVRVEGQDPYGVDDVDRAYDYLGDTYDFYYDYHGRNSYNDAGADLIAKVRYGEWNAWWYSSYMVIGEGCVTDDTVGHEFTHGVTEAECNLDYYGESGAINESFSDMWGEWIDQVNGRGNDAPAVKWYLFEDDIYGAFRNMKNPHEFDDPDRLYGTYWVWDDPGGYEYLHSNNGVGNKLCYLLTDGDTFNGYTISGMGISKTADLFYECQTNLLTSSAEYYDLGNVLILAASNLGLTQTERDNVKNACAAVEILPYPDDCFPICDPNYDEWVAIGRPECWCTPYQCDGDADGKTSGFPYYYRVFTGDLTLLIENWGKKIDDPTLNPCADVDHIDSGFPYHYRVFTGDLSIVVANWRKKDGDLPGNCASCERGQQAKGSELSIKDIMKWLEEIWLDPEVQKDLDKDALLKLIESIKEMLKEQM